jgi:hypothetical protein
MKPATHPRDLHTQAARNLEEAAQLHREAAMCHDQNRLVAARRSAKSAMECCARAQVHSQTACESSEQLVEMHDDLDHGSISAMGHMHEPALRGPAQGTLSLKPR